MQTRTSNKGDRSQTHCEHLQEKQLSTFTGGLIHLPKYFPAVSALAQESKGFVVYLPFPLDKVFLIILSVWGNADVNVCLGASLV